MRDCCGANDHPDLSLFIQVYRLVSIYSLVKPPTGLNISKTEIFNVLWSIKDIENESERKEQWEAQLNTILDRGCNTDALIEITKLIQEHDYYKSETSMYANSYIAGYVARKASMRFARFLKDKKPFICDKFTSTLLLSPSDPIPERHELIELRSKGYLKHPSLKLSTLIDVLETAVMSIVGNDKIEADTLLNGSRKLHDLSPLPFIGREEHLEQLKTISKLDLGVKWLNVSFRRTTNEKKTTNNYKRFRSSISNVNGSSFIFEELQSIKAQLQTISELELGGKWVRVRFRGTTNDKNTTTNDFEAWSWGKMTQR